jgi:RNA polymerase sigma-70 factor, ECF subfamily
VRYDDERASGSVREHLTRRSSEEVSHLPAQDSDHEAEIRRLWDVGDRRAAAGETVNRYGPEIFGLLRALHHDEDEAGDAFSDFAERLLSSMDQFAYECSMRTWAYLLARRASQDVLRAARRRDNRAVSVSNADELGLLVANVRTRTMTILRSEAKSELARLRDELPPDDQLLLVLRVDRKLAWSDLARVFLDAKSSPSGDRLATESARLRKRFQSVKERLSTLARQRGVIGKVE